MKISVITISLNTADTIERTLRSVQIQNYHDYEYIVVDGGSTDGTVDIIRRYEKNITRWISEPDGGIYNAMNKAAAMATGDYCLFLNAGDMLVSPHVLTEASDYLDGVHNIVAGREIIFKGNRIVAHYYPPKRLSLDYLVLTTNLRHQSTFAKRDLILEFPFDENLRLVSDWKFWLEVVANGKHRYSYMPIDVSFFDATGRSATMHPVGMKEHGIVYDELFTAEQLASFNRRRHHKDLLGIWRRAVAKVARICRKQQTPRQLRINLREYTNISPMNGLD